MTYVYPFFYENHLNFVICQTLQSFEHGQYSSWLAETIRELVEWGIG